MKATASVPRMGGTVRVSPTRGTQMGLVSTAPPISSGLTSSSKPPLRRTVGMAIAPRRLEQNECEKKLDGVKGIIEGYGLRIWKRTD